MFNVALAAPAAADTLPTRDGIASTVSADPLPTTQINGVAWSQAVHNNVVYVGGKFTSARPAGSPAGQNETPRSNFLTYDLTTGELLPWGPSFNGQVKVVRVSPDGSTLYVGGQFTAVDGVSRYRLAAFDIATRTLKRWQPNINATVNALAVTDTAAYIGGSFTRVGGQLRDGAAAVRLSDAGVTDFNPILSNGDPQSIITSPDYSKVVIGGNFTAVNGSNDPGYGLAMVDPQTGTSLPLPVNSIVRNGNTYGAIMDLYATPDGFYGAGFSQSRNQANLEGIFRATWDGDLTWLGDCHGDSYSIYVNDDAVYQAGHAHYCGNMDGFPQMPTWTYNHSLAFSKDVRGTIAREHLGYHNFFGQPRPELLTWFPLYQVGTFTGLSQAVWNVSGQGDYVVYGGEFLKVNNIAQQGLVRYAKKPTVTPKTGPVISSTPLQFLPLQNGTLRVGWVAGSDPDNENLLYRLYRDGEKIYEGVTDSTFWRQPVISHIDSGLTAGTAYNYQVRISDPDGNATWTPTVRYTYQAGTRSTYDKYVLADNPLHYWSLDESSGDADDLSTGMTGIKNSRVSSGAPSIIADSTAFRFPGGTNASTVIPQTRAMPTNAFSVEAWFRTTSTSGGGIVNFGNATSGNSSSTTLDRVLYLNNSGNVYFGVKPGVVLTVASPAQYNDGAWHHVVGTMSTEGLRLYVDGQQVSSRADATNGYNFSGVWRIGGDYLNGWTSNPSSRWLAGDIDAVAVYPYQLSGDQVTGHNSVGRTGVAPNRAPTASFIVSAHNLQVGVDGSGSTDSDGTIASYAWDFGDGTSATGATASHTYAEAGTFKVKLTVTDDKGATASSEKQVTVAPNQTPAAAFTLGGENLTAQVDASGSNDPDGTITAYAWDFGDGKSATGVQASHTYAKAGTYTVKLTVTDNDGGTAETTQQFTATEPPNQDPTAAFTTKVTGLTVAVDGKTSADPDGTITAYAWDFGDGKSATGVQASHTYAKAGTYTVKLTVTDNRGGTATASKQVSVTTTAISDEFGRTGTRWGTADTGGTYTYTNSSYFSTDGSVGKISLPAAGRTGAAYLTETSALNTDTTFDVSLDTNTSGSGVQITTIGRRIDSGTDYRMTVQISGDKSVRLNLTKRVNGTATNLRDVLVKGLTYTTGQTLHVRFTITGSGTTTLSGKVWAAGTDEPGDPQITRTDTSPELQAPGSFALSTYLMGTSTIVPMIVDFDNLNVQAE